MQLLDFELSIATCSATFREALKEAYNQLTKNGHKLDTKTFMKFMWEYKPLMRELHEKWYISNI